MNTEIFSLVPAFLHTNVAKACISRKIPLVTASYILPEMQALDAEAKAAVTSFYNLLLRRA
jgi:alpha-aminoadipic semialdehyde synthase